MPRKNLLNAAEEDKKDNIAYGHRVPLRLEFPEMEGIIVGDWKLIKNLTDSTYELYNLKNDPLEKKNLFKTTEDIYGTSRELLSKLLGMKQDRAGIAEEAVLDEEGIRELKALGYIQ